jgi:hypothetical protein
MTTQKQPSRRGRKRWGELVRFLTDTMKNSQNERVRMAAAQRLTDILILREQREQLEIRRELRDVGKTLGTPETPGQPTAPSGTQGSEEETVDAFLARIRGSKAEEIEPEDE